MDKEKQLLTEQRNRLSEVIKYLKDRGELQQEIAAKTKVDTIYISHLKSGMIKYIPKEFLDNLHSAYNINPAYVRLESNFILDTIGTKLNNFEKFVDSWDTVKKGSDKYLHFTIDRNFYDFLLDVDKSRLATDDGISCLDIEIGNLKELYSGGSNPEEFVLIPRNSFMEIIHETVEDRKQLSEVIDFEEHCNYILK